MRYTLKRRIKRGLITSYHALCVDKLLMRIGFFDKKINNAIEKFGGNSTLTKAQLVADIKDAFCNHLTTPTEYFLFGFEGKGEEYRAEFLSDGWRVRQLLSVTGERKLVEDLTDKFAFYERTKKFFGRSAFLLKQGEDYKKFEAFVKNHRTLFVKPLSASFGSGAHKLDIEEGMDIKVLYDDYISKGTWILEDRVEQVATMAQWCDTCINTVRLPCFYKKNGGMKVLNPFIRTGRQGAVVDNGGAGGVFACIDEETGILNSVGFDEANNFYSCHPDSGLKYVGWQVPQWQELLQLAERIFKESLPDHVYIGFDFALTDKGWVLIEGNWGQFLGQYASRIGVKKKFLQYLKG